MGLYTPFSRTKRFAQMVRRLAQTSALTTNHFKLPTSRLLVLTFCQCAIQAVLPAHADSEWWASRPNPGATILLLYSSQPHDGCCIHPAAQNPWGSEVTSRKSLSLLKYPAPPDGSKRDLRNSLEREKLITKDYQAKCEL